MPYSSNSDLPESVRSRYSDNCQSVFRHTFNSVLEDHHDEQRAFASAHGQAKKCEGNKAMTDLYTSAMEPKFKIFAPMLRASLDADGKRRLHGVASSTIADRHGDQILLSALSDMERSANKGLTIFLNHSYEVPEDVAGTVERAQIRSSAQDPDIHDLVLDIVLNESNPRALSAWDAIQNGTQLGLSIGAMIPPGGASRDRKSGTFTVEHLDLVETSLVGVPANPRSWVEYAVKSLQRAAAGDFVAKEAETFGVAERPEEPGELVVGEEIPQHEPQAAEEPAPPESPTEEPAPPEGDVEPEEVDVDVQAGLQVIDFTNYDLLSDSGDAETVHNATVNIKTPYADVSIDTGNRGAAAGSGSSQEASVSDPETEDEDKAEQSPWAGILPVTSDLDVADVETALQILEPTVVASLRSTSEILKAVTSELIETRAQLQTRNAEYAALEEATVAVVAQTGQILDKLSNTPMGRRSVVREVGSEFAALKAVYGEDFLNLLKRS